MLWADVIEQAVEPRGQGRAASLKCWEQRGPQAASPSVASLPTCPAPSTTCMQPRTVRAGSVREAYAALKPCSARPTAARRPAPPAPMTMASYSWSITAYPWVAKHRTPAKDCAARPAAWRRAAMSKRWSDCGSQADQWRPARGAEPLLSSRNGHSTIYLLCLLCGGRARLSAHASAVRSRAHASRGDCSVPRCSGCACASHRTSKHETRRGAHRLVMIVKVARR